MSRMTFEATDTEDSWEQVLDYVDENYPDAISLSHVEDDMDAALHQVWLNEATGDVLHAVRDMQDGDRDHLDIEFAAEAIEWLDEVAELCRDALANPADHYGYGGHRTAEDDLAVIDEVNSVHLVAMRSEAQHRIEAVRADGSSGSQEIADGLRVSHLVDMEIRRELDRARAAIGRLAGLRASHIRELVGTERGGQAKAARELGITPVTVHNIVKDDDDRRERLVTDAREAAARNSD